VVPSYLLQPVSVDKSNYQPVLIGSGYYTEAQVQ
jgi:putative multiple sugar transport system substrate-binding protein